MHYIDLLNYLIDVQKIEKDELCELIAIPKKKLDSVLSGITPLKKKCLKNLSLYTNIPLDAIRSGNFVLNIPQEEIAEGEEAPEIIKDAYVPEYIREANTNRLKAYCKKRYKNRRDDILGFNIVNIIFFVISIIISFSLIYNFTIVSLSGSAKILAIALIPTVLSIIITINSYKLAWNGTLKEEKLFIFYAVLNVIQIFTYTIALVVAKWAPPFTVLLGILAIAPVIYTVFLENKDKSNYVKSLVLYLFSAFSTCVVCILASTSEYFMNLEDERSLIIGIVISFIGFFTIVITTGILLAAYTFYRKRNYIAKHFEPVSKKRVFKGNKIAKDIIVILLLISLTCGVLYVLPVIGYNNIIKQVINADIQIDDRYPVYDKASIVFTENDKYTVIEAENYTIKVPESLVKKSDSEYLKNEIYSNSENTMSVIVINQFYDLEEMFTEINTLDELPFDLKQVITDRYGFFPKTLYENDKLLKMVYNDNISVLDRDLTLATSYFLLTESILSFDDKIYLYDNGVIELRINKHCFTRDDGKTSYFYDISGNVKGNYEKYFDFQVLTICDSAEDDVAYKIINSIEFN